MDSASRLWSTNIHRWRGRRQDPRPEPFRAANRRCWRWRGALVSEPAFHPARPNRRRPFAGHGERDAGAHQGADPRAARILMVEQNIREAMPIADRLYIPGRRRKALRRHAGDVRNDRQIMDIYMGGA